MIEPWLMPFDDDSARKVLDSPQSQRNTPLLLDWEGKSSETDPRQHTTGPLFQRSDCLREAVQKGFRVTVRINRPNHLTESEIKELVRSGASAVLLAMIETPEEIERVRPLVPSDMRLGAMVETPGALRSVGNFSKIGVDFAFFGLLDFARITGAKSLWTPLFDGTIQDCRDRLSEIAFGFGGLTVPGTGKPLSDSTLLRHMTILGADFSFLRRTFFRGLGDMALTKGIELVNKAVLDMFHEVAADGSNHLGNPK